MKRAWTDNPDRRAVVRIAVAVTRLGEQRWPGEGAVLYDLPRSSETCGARLQ